MLFTTPGTQPAIAGSTPELSIVTPRGLQRGTTRSFLFHGKRLGGTVEVFYYDEGLSTEEIRVVDGKTVEISIRAEGDCRLGEHIVQLRTRHGVTEFRTIYVGPFQEVAEFETGDNPIVQEIESGVTVNGIITPEDRDAFAVHVKKGDRLSVEIEAMRLGVWFDPHLELTDSTGRVVAVSDDTVLHLSDGFLSIIAETGGRHQIHVRAADFGGSSVSHYRLHVGDFVRPQQVFPVGGLPQKEIELTLFGGADDGETIKTTLPAASRETVEPVSIEPDRPTPSRLPMVISELSPHRDQEPNNAFAESQQVAFPAAIDGIIQADGDLDTYRFPLKKGDQVSIQCFARSAGSPLDSFVIMFAPDNRRVQANDDTAGNRDSVVKYTAKEDGKYFVRVQSQTRNAGPNFVYRLHIDRQPPKFNFGIKRNDRYTQRRQQITVPRGNRFAVLVEGTRAGFTGTVELASDNLPSGVSMHARPMHEDLNLMPVVFEATADAEVQGHLVRWTAKGTGDFADVIGEFRMLGMLSLGSPNRALYHGCTVDQVAVAVTEPVPFRLELVPRTAPVVKNGTAEIQVKIVRDEGFDQPIRLQFPFRPPGLGTRYETVAKRDQSIISHPININRNASTGTWAYYLIGTSDFKGPAWVSTELGELTIEEPYVTAAAPTLRMGRGEKAKLSFQLDHHKAFDGDAVAELRGLPLGVTAVATQSFDAETATIEFQIETTDKTPPGKHSLSLNIKIPAGSETIDSMAGSVEFRVNAAGKANVANNP